MVIKDRIDNQLSKWFRCDLACSEEGRWIRKQMIPTYVWIRIANSWSMYASFIPFSHSIYDCFMKVEGSSIPCNIFLRSLLAYDHATEESSMQNR